MATLSKAGQALQARLTRKFRDSLPEKRERIAACWHRVQSEDWPPELVGELRMHAHRLSGSAGSYGMDGLGQAAGELSRALKVGAGSTAQRLLVEQRVHMLMDLLESSGAEIS